MSNDLLILPAALVIGRKRRKIRLFGNIATFLSVL